MQEYTRETYPSSGKKYSGEKAIISLTSWKARINTVGLTLFSLLKQCPGFHIVLVLSEEEFPKKEAELPENLMLFVKAKKIELLWVYRNYKSFKKVLFTMDKYRDVPVISADDDCLYTCNYAQELYDAWTKNKTSVITNDGGHNDLLDWGRGPNTLYPPNFRPDPVAVCNAYFSAKLGYVEDDITLGVLRTIHQSEIIDLKHNSYYSFHNEINPQSANIRPSHAQIITSIKKIFIRTFYI